MSLWALIVIMILFASGVVMLVLVSFEAFFLTIGFMVILFSDSPWLLLGWLAWTISWIWRLRVRAGLNNRLTGTLMGRCRVCCSSKDVVSYDPREVWFYPWRRTWCPEHCPDHDYVYMRGDGGHFCDHCGERPPEDWYSC